MPPSAQASSMPPPIPVPAFLTSDQPVHPANGESQADKTSTSDGEATAPSVVEADGAAGDGADGGGETQKEVVKLPEIKPGPGGIRRKRSGIIAKRKLTWVDDHGVDIAQIKEFEPSDSEDSEDEDGDEESQQACSCVIQ